PTTCTRYEHLASTSHPVLMRVFTRLVDIELVVRVLHGRDGVTTGDQYRNQLLEQCGLPAAAPAREPNHTHVYSATSIAGSRALLLVPGRTPSTRAAQYLNSGILPNGSSLGLVSLLAGLSAKQNGMKIMPSATSQSARRTASMRPRRVSTAIL